MSSISQTDNYRYNLDVEIYINISPADRAIHYVVCTIDNTVSKYYSPYDLVKFNTQLQNLHKISIYRYRYPSRFESIKR